MQALSFEMVQRMGGEMPPRAKPVVIRAARDGGEIRESLIAAGVLRPRDVGAPSEIPAPPAPVAGVYTIDGDGLRDAAIEILFGGSPCTPARFAAILLQCDERLRAPLIALAARHGLRAAP